MNQKVTSRNTFPVTMGRSGIQMIENLQIYDMVWGMTHLNRFTGKCDRQISVAAHNLHCFTIAKIWQPLNYDLQLYALTHDLPEAYYGDFPGFLKKHLGADFEEVLSRIDNTIFDQLGLPYDVRVPLEDDLKRIDSSALVLEAAYAFDKWEPYHWPPIDLYEEIDIIQDIVEGYDDVGLYNSFNSTLELLGEHNEALRNLLHDHRTYSHPQRVRLG